MSRLQRTGNAATRGLEDRTEQALERLYGEATSAATAYTPAVAADWSGDPPTTVQEALDRIAAALGPIA